MVESFVARVASRAWLQNIGPLQPTQTVKSILAESRRVPVSSSRQPGLGRTIAASLALRCSKMVVERWDPPKSDPHRHVQKAEPDSVARSQTTEFHIPGEAVGLAQGEVSTGYLVPAQHEPQHSRTTSSSPLRH